MEKQTESTQKSVILFADGGSRGNPGHAACGYVVYIHDQEFADAPTALDFALNANPDERAGQYLGIATNNVAEWQGVINGLEWIENNIKQVGSLFIFLDSQLVVKQVLGEYKVKQDHLKPLHKMVANLLKSFDNWHIEHIYRKDNSLADQEVNAVLDEYLK